MNKLPCSFLTEHNFCSEVYFEAKIYCVYFPITSLYELYKMENDF